MDVEKNGMENKPLRHTAAEMSQSAHMITPGPQFEALIGGKFCDEDDHE